MFNSIVTVSHSFITYTVSLQKLLARTTLTLLYSRKPTFDHLLPCVIWDRNIPHIADFHHRNRTRSRTRHSCFSNTRFCGCSRYRLSRSMWRSNSTSNSVFLFVFASDLSCTVSKICRDISKDGASDFIFLPGAITGA